MTCAGRRSQTSTTETPRMENATEGKDQSPRTAKRLRAYRPEAGSRTEPNSSEQFFFIITVIIHTHGHPAPPCSTPLHTAPLGEPITPSDVQACAEKRPAETDLYSPSLSRLLFHQTDSCPCFYTDTEQPGVCVMCV